jgi:hypothetical protein
MTNLKQTAGRGLAGGKIHIPFVPSIYFLCFLTSNLLLAHEDLSLGVQLQIVLLGLVLPLIFAWVSRSSEEGQKDFVWPDSSSGVSLWIWAFTFLAGVFLRLYHLVSLSQWPLPDEGGDNFFAIELSDKGIWKIFYSSHQHPPLFYWIFGCFYKIVPPSLFSSWLFTALISIGALMAAFWAIRLFSMGTFGWFCFFLVSTGFWPLYTGRICCVQGLTFFWEWLTLGFLGLYFKKKGTPFSFGYAVALGICLGLGLFIFAGWLLVAALIVPFFFFTAFKKDPPAWKAFCVSFMLFGLIFAAVYGTRLPLVPWGTLLHSGWDPLQRVLGTLSYVRAIFWKGMDLYYGPLWGGLLNPVLGAFFFLGLALLLRRKKLSWTLWLVYGLMVLGLPAVISVGLETFRILNLFPLLIFISVLGASELALSWGRLRGMVVILLIIGSFFDIGQLYGPYHNLWGTPGPIWHSMKSTVNYRAYQDLDGLQKREGPGLVLSDLSGLNFSDKVFTLAVYPFDASQNPRLRAEDAKWAAVIVNKEYQPFLSKRFPRMRWYNLGREQPGDKVEWLLGFLPVNSGDFQVIQLWLRANQAFRRFKDRNSLFPEELSDAIRDFYATQASLGDDAFLWSCYLEKMGFIYIVLEKDYGACRSLLEKNLKRAYPLSWLVYLRGNLPDRSLAQGGGAK